MTAIITAAASFAGAALAAWMSLRIAGQRLEHERRQEAVRRAFDSAGSHMAVVAFDKYVQFEVPSVFRLPEARGYAAVSFAR